MARTVLTTLVGLSLSNGSFQVPSQQIIMRFMGSPPRQPRQLCKLCSFTLLVGCCAPCDAASTEMIGAEEVGFPGISPADHLRSACNAREKLVSLCRSLTLRPALIRRYAKI